MIESTMSGNKKIPLLMVVVFFGPFIAALWLVEFGREYIPLGEAAKGELIHPARPLAPFEIGLPLTGGKLDRAFFTGKWTYVVFAPGSCDSTCLDNLYKIRQVRLTQGGNEQRIQRLIVFTRPVDISRFQETLHDHAGLVVAEDTQDSADGLKSQFNAGGAFSGGGAGIYMVDPLGNFFIFYRNSADPTDMRKDLTKLLHSSRIG